MKAGDLVRFATGRGRETKIGVLVDVHDNPADLSAPQMTIRSQFSLYPRQVARVLCEGKKWSSWLAHVEVVSEGR